MSTFLIYEDFEKNLASNDNEIKIQKSLTQTDITAQKKTFSIKGFFCKCDQIRRKLQIWSHLLKKSLMKNLVFFGLYQSILFKVLAIN